MRAELELIKSKYEKKIQSLMLNNNELNARVKNLMNSLISLKDYALNMERNMKGKNSNNSLIRNNNNYSAMLKNNNNYSFMNEESGNNSINNNNNLNLTYQGQYNNYDYNYEENNQKNKDLLNSMKNDLCCCKNFFFFFS